ncbi:MAG: hypothetical protein FWD06_03435 [Oscillospiraceae bacterium]|nr:hypothetical protein [Oscillospiraceae bacterium]
MLNILANLAIIIGGVLGSIGFFVAGNNWLGGLGLVIALFNAYRLFT